MKALDTNILVRLLTADDEAALERVKTLLRNAEEQNVTFLITDLALLELIWVLRSSYQLNREKILDAVDALLGMSVLTFESSTVINHLLILGRETDFDLADILIGLNARQKGCTSTFTFDKKAGQSELFIEVP